MGDSAKQGTNIIFTCAICNQPQFIFRRSTQGLVRLKVGMFPAQNTFGQNPMGDGKSPFPGKLNFLLGLRGEEQGFLGWQNLPENPRRIL